MKETRDFCTIIILLLLAKLNSVAQPQSMVAFGLTNVTLGQAAFAGTNGIPIVTNLSSEGVDGISILLGEPDSGAFIYVNTMAYPEQGDYMIGKAYGKSGGLTDQLICTIRARRMDPGGGFGVYPVEVDFTPLGATNLLFQVYSGSRLVAQATHAGGEAVVRTDFNGGRIIRVNPYWRMPDGTTGALFEFSSSTGFNFPETFDGGGLIPFGERFFVRPLNPTNAVEFISRVDVTSGGLPGGEEGNGLSTFEFDDISLGVFHRAHRAVGEATLLAKDGTLTIENFVQAPEEDEAGVAVEVDQANRFSLSLAPVDLATESTAVSLTAIGVLSRGNYGPYIPGYYFGSARIYNDAGTLRIAGHLPALGTEASRAQIEVYSNSVLIGLSPPMTELPSVSLSGHPSVTGFRAFGNTLESRPGLTIQFNEAISFAFTNDTNSLVFEGDEIRLLAIDPAQFSNGFTGFLEAVTAVTLTGTGLPSLSIIGEVEDPPIAPLLSIAHSPQSVVLSWVDPNEKYLLEASDSFETEFHYVPVAEEFSNNVATLRITPPPHPNQFYRLRHSGFYY